MKIKSLLFFVVLFCIESNAQLQQQNVADNSGFTTLYSLSTGLSAGYSGNNIQAQLAFNNHYNGGSNMFTYSAIAGGVENPSLDYGGKLFLRTANNTGLLVTALTIDKVQNSNFSGKVGIGTATPSEKFVVNGDGAKIKIETSSNPSNYYAYLESKYDANNPFNLVSQGIQIFGTKNIGIGTPDTYVNNYYGIAFATQNLTAENANVRMYINQVGKVGIGTTHPDEKLTVKGKIHSEEVKVDLAIPADYVFQKYYTGKSNLKSDYVMPTLAEIENYTKKNHHLPNVPSAEEIKQNGLSLGEMSNVLLQKVEELTLYVIEQQKKLDEQNKTIEMQSKILEALTKRLNSFINTY